ncbi:hypothetical protein SDC9_204331 [bioreactor metagenome]|uniref:Uncharacterized protein n=1 Tax=bioreactor metagenome TaxID=1076179 RepID=A0A645IZ84_9ZZZZ
MDDFEIVSKSNLSRNHCITHHLLHEVFTVLARKLKFLSKMHFVISNLPLHILLHHVGKKLWINVWKKI